MVKNMSNSLTYIVASSCVCTSPLAVMTIVGLHDFVKVSISAEFKSLLLIMCIDAPKSTTNSRSSGLRIDAGRHPFPEGEKNVALSCSFILNTPFGQLPRCFAGTLLLPLCLLLRPILKFWSVGAALILRMRGLGSTGAERGVECGTGPVKEAQPAEFVPTVRIAARHVHAPSCLTYEYEATRAWTSGLRQYLLCALVANEALRQRVCQRPASPNS